MVLNDLDLPGLTSVAKISLVPLKTCLSCMPNVCGVNDLMSQYLPTDSSKHSLYLLLCKQVVKNDFYQVISRLKNELPYYLLILQNSNVQ